MTKKQGIKKTGIIAAGLACLLLAGTSAAAYAAVSRPSPEVSVEVMEDGTKQFRVGSYGADEYGIRSIAVIVTEDGDKLVGYSVECLPEEWQSQLEAEGSTQALNVTVDEDGHMIIGEGEAGIVTLNEGGFMVVGRTSNAEGHLSRVIEAIVTEGTHGIMVFTEDGMKAVETLEEALTIAE